MLAIIAAYLIGAIPTGHLLAKIYGVDLKRTGSGNVGATNVARVIGKKAGILTLVIDITKGALATSLVFLEPSVSPAALAFSAVAGHCISLPPMLKGGKGVATAFGASLALTPVLSLLILLVFVLVFFKTKIVSLASVCAAVSFAPFGYLLMEQKFDTVWLSLLAALVVLRHRENISRIIRGEEKQFKAKG